jgi:hypothetical protein
MKRARGISPTRKAFWGQTKVPVKTVVRMGTTDAPFIAAACYDDREFLLLGKSKEVMR